MKVQELIDFVTNNKFYSIWDMEDALEESQKIVDENLEICKHRWYETSTTVYELEDGYVGVRGVSNMYSENMSSKDCGFVCRAYEYEKFQTISYRVKQNK